MRKCWLPAFSPFPTVFSKDFFKSWDSVAKIYHKIKGVKLQHPMKTLLGSCLRQQISLYIPRKVHYVHVTREVKFS